MEIICLDFNTIYIPPLNNIGTVAVPINLLCSVPGLNKYVTCFVCHLDCVYSHNTYGGTCEKDENDAFTCLCARTEEEAKRRKIFPSSKETCQAFSALNPVCKNCIEKSKTRFIYAKTLLNILGDIEEIALSKALEARTSLLLCPGSDENYETSGCSTDCSKNHDAKKGVDCKVTPSIYGNNEERLHCNCL